MSYNLLGDNVVVDVSTRGDTSKPEKFIDGKVIGVGMKYQESVDKLKEEHDKFSITKYNPVTVEGNRSMLADGTQILIEDSDGEFHLFPHSRIVDRS